MTEKRKEEQEKKRHEKEESERKRRELVDERRREQEKKQQERVGRGMKTRGVVAKASSTEKDGAEDQDRQDGVSGVF